ncbi:MAG TPA: hypothetical protein VNU71_03550 [Burkholderiaceae bacterium]|nr:hypothetical protein [Burkholderiaceae bacterium]
MWIMFGRAPAPDAAYWPGRRWMAAIDAMAWPVAAALLLARVPGRTGVLLPTAVAVLALLGMLRLRKAVWLNHRYRFTTRKVTGILVVLMFIGIVVKVGWA